MNTPTQYTLWMRRSYEVNTDPQRRCYNGCHASSEIVQGPWISLGNVGPIEKAEGRLKYMRDLNDFAVSQRGPSAKTEYRLEPEES